MYWEEESIPQQGDSFEDEEENKTTKSQRVGGSQGKDVLYTNYITKSPYTSKAIINGGFEIDD